ncbi:DUF2812 domain-containing protein [Streptococcus marimammalium]|uniref:DUF2812 domain-containing protein n=1 Tax=Streptococcus marimammalium TaxID=269666 RepID=UPI001E5DC877|nr:DUF2812 domain-containing protein [Streptococcus marimammalium]
MVDFLEEERFIEQQHQNGWRFVDIKGLNTYVFEETKPEIYVYQLDILEQNSDEKFSKSHCFRSTDHGYFRLL